MSNIFEQLKEPFKPDEIQWRIGQKSKDGKKATVMAYMDSRAVQERLDSVVGPENWRVEYSSVDLGQIGNKDIKGFICSLSIKIDDNWLTRQDGAGCTDFEPLKGGISDAFKRAASSFGIGRYLYALPLQWVPIDNYGKFKIPSLPLWAMPKGTITANSTTEVTAQNNISPSADSTQTKICFTLGKYRGTAVSDLKDLSYLEWVVDKSNFSDEVKSEATKVLSTKSVDNGNDISKPKAEQFEPVKPPCDFPAFSGIENEEPF